MSIPSGKPSNPADVSDHAPRPPRERMPAERQPDADEPFRSPYAPRRPHERAAVPPSSVESDTDPLSLYAPKAPRERGVPELTEGEAGHPIASESTFDGDAPHDGPGGRLSSERADDVVGGHPVDLDAAASLQPAHPNFGRPHASADGRDETGVDRDLERLEASLRWLQRQDTEARLARGAPSTTPSDLRGRRSTADVYGVRPPLSLEPERLPPPPTSRDHLRWPLRLFIVAGVAAPIVYYFAGGSWRPPAEPAGEPQLASIDAADTPAVTVQQLWPGAAQRDDLATSATNEAPVRSTKASQPERVRLEMSAEEPVPAERSQPARPPERERMAMAAPPAPAEAPPVAAPAKAVRTLGAEEIALLLKQGEQFMAAGDLVTARTVLQRAAEADDAVAAVALGATYDPAVLARLGVIGMAADVNKARSWYQKAESLGSSEATRRLKILANR